MTCRGASRAAASRFTGGNTESGRGERLPPSSARALTPAPPIPGFCLCGQPLILITVLPLVGRSVDWLLWFVVCLSFFFFFFALNKVGSLRGMIKKGSPSRLDHARLVWNPAQPRWGPLCQSSGRDRLMEKRESPVNLPADGKHATVSQEWGTLPQASRAASWARLPGASRASRPSNTCGF